VAVLKQAEAGMLVVAHGHASEFTTAHRFTFK
jgi:hypothetical protein